jgi:uncharacterized membrane protein YhaH (DUF805 family)
MSSNPYTPPRAAVSDVESEQEFQEIRMWSPKGRLGRLRYLAYFTGAYLILGAIMAGVNAAASEAVAGAIFLLLYAVAAVFGILVAIQRSHDMDWSGWTVLLQLIPLVGFIWVFKRGTEGPNTYGPPPPPNTLGVKILGVLLPVIFLIGIAAAIAIPAYVQYTQRAAGG